MLLACYLPVATGVFAAVDPFPLVTARVQSWVDRGYYSGCSVWIVQGNRTCYERCFGNATPTTGVYIASAGKWLASAAVLAVVDGKTLSLDDRVVKWIPEFGTDSKGGATLRQLFSHTSGYPPYQPEDRPCDGYQSCSESVEHLLPLAPHYASGERFEYGGLAMQVAGRMVEVTTGKEWETIFQEMIAKPLGMTGTHFTPVDPGHTPMLAGGAVSTLHDYERFLTMIAEGGMFSGRRVLSKDGITAMEADQVGNALVKREEFVERLRGKTHRGIYGLGMWREELDEKGGVTLMSSPSWAGTYPWIDKRHDIRGLIIAHVDCPRANKARFSGFWTSPILADMVRAELEWRKPADLPAYEEGIIPAGQGDLAYEAAGAGEPVVLLHGHSLDRRMWDPQFAELAKHYRVIRYDLRGYGLSDKPAEGQDFLHAEDLRAVLDTLHVDKAHIVGLSLGGYVVLDFLALHPDRILTATIASGGIHRGAGSRKLADLKERDARLAEIEAVRSEGIDVFKKRWCMMLLKGSTMAPAEAGLLTAMIADWSAWQPLHIEPQLVLGPAAIERLAKTRTLVPVLWLRGERDAASPDRESIAAVLPNLRMVTIPNAGHMSNMEQPAAFTAALRDFMGRSQNRSER